MTDGAVAAPRAAPTAAAPAAQSASRRRSTRWMRCGRGSASAAYVRCQSAWSYTRSGEGWCSMHTIRPRFFSQVGATALPPWRPDRVGPTVTTTAMTRALEQDAQALLAEYDAGSWYPTPSEQLLAEGLARCPWDHDLPGRAARGSGRRQGRPPGRRPASGGGRPGVRHITRARPALFAMRQLLDALAAEEGPCRAAEK